MTPAEKQAELVARYGIVPEPQERLAIIVGRGKKGAPMPEDERTDAHRVQGCTSRVWVVGELQEGRCHFRVDADSALVKGLAAFVCEVYEGAQPEEAMSFTTTVLEELGVEAQLTPTRQHGLRQVALAAQDWARRLSV